MNIIFETVLYVYLLYHKDFIIENLADAYRDIAVEKIQRIFFWGTLIDSIINLIMHSYGFASVTTHKITVYNNFICIMLFAIFAKIVISYLNM